MGRACACYAAMERSEGRFQFVGRCPDGGPYQDTRAENPRYAQPHYARGYSPGTLCSPAPRFAPSEPSMPVSSPRDKHRCVRRPPHRPGQQMVDLPIEHLVTRRADGIEEPLLLQVLVHLRAGEGGIRPQVSAQSAIPMPHWKELSLTPFTLDGSGEDQRYQPEACQARWSADTSPR